MKVSILAVHEQDLTVEASFLGSETFLLTFLYAKCDHILRRPLWSHLSGLVTSSSECGLG